MPFEHAIWTVGEDPTPLPVTSLSNEQVLEDMIVRDPRILSSEWMLIGRQEITPSGGRIDLLALAPDASLVLIELKREKTARDIVAQALDYLRQHASDPEMAEYFVRIKWLDAVPADKAIHETGFFGQQNSVCKPRATKWRHTVERLKASFPNWNG